MIFKVEVSAQAKTDMREIYEYIALTLLSPQNAKGQLDRLEKAIMSLDNMPMRYREYETDLWRSRGLRIMPVDNFVVLYIPNEETSVVTVIRVMYGGRDIDEQLKNTDF